MKISILLQILIIISNLVLNLHGKDILEILILPILLEISILTILLEILMIINNITWNLDINNIATNLDNH